jgi:Ca-activated chloride channel family protein
MRQYAIPITFILIFCILFSSHFTGDLYADGFIIHQPRPGERILPLSVKYHRVAVEIVDQVATTSIDQVFINDHSRDIEGMFIFPLPEKAAISEFAMFVEGKKVKGEVLDRDKARWIYEDIVRKMKDPALLEYMGRNMFRARIYPIPAKGEKRVQLSYTEILKAENNLVRYIYPLDTERFSHQPIQQVSISAQISSRIPISSVYSPSHKISVRKEEEARVRVSFEDSDVKPDKDFHIYYSLTKDDIGLSFMNWGGVDDSYFMFLASPPYMRHKEKIVNKNLIFVLDSSGSMAGRKMKQAKDAVRFIINHLDKKDRFTVIDFDDGVNTFYSEIVPASPENRDKALRFVDEIEDSGGTNINDALLQAVKMIEPGEKPSYILFLTDGLPTVGETGTAEILKNIKKANVRKARLFVFGVGYDVNTELLDRLSSDNRGTSVYVGKEDDIEVAVSDYYEKISSPLLSGINIDFENIQVRDVYPKDLPDLFKGSQIVLIGRYRGIGPVTAVLSGKVGKKERTFTLKDQMLTKEDTYSFLPRLWATRRIGYLLEEIRLHGEKKELIEEVKRLSLKFGIVTPYTSFLVTESERQTLDAAAPEAQIAFEEKEVRGVGAVRIAKATQRMKGEEQSVFVESQRIKYRADKTFYLKEGYWVDSEYKEGDPVTKMMFNSEEYFRIIAEKPGIARYLSVAVKVIVHYQGTNYKIIGESSEGESEKGD